MADTVNKVKNGDFATGKAAPRHWTWTARTEGVRWERGLQDRPSESGGITIISDSTDGTGLWSQVVVCKPGEFYRIDATVTCDVEAEGDAAGCVVSVQPQGEDLEADVADACLATPALHRTSETVDIRTYYEAPPGVRRLKISIGLIEARGSASLHEVRFIRIIEPDADSHMMAVPPPPYACRPPLMAKTVCVCSYEAQERPVTRILAEYLGEEHVQALVPKELRPSSLRADAILLPDPTPPVSIRSLASLTRLAADRIVVISLPAFATLARGALHLRRIGQDDDPIHAKVMHADFATRGFALEDTFPYAWQGARVGSFVQNQFRRTGALQAFCKKHGFEARLVSMCDRDATCDRPICLHRLTARGALFVLDIEPVEAAGSTFGEAVLAVHLLLSMLGRPVTGLGQYVAAVRKEAEFRELIREMRSRFPYFNVHDADVPVDEVTEQSVTIGDEDRMYGLPLEPKPVILVRSGLEAGDMESVYGSLLWFKQLIRMEPYRCPYVDALASRFRFAWIPCVAPWESHEGWRRSHRLLRGPAILGSGLDAVVADQVGVIIDVVSRAINRVRVVIPQAAGQYSRYASWLPRLARVFAGDGFFSFAVEDGDGFTDRNRFAWRHERHELEVAADAEAFADDPHRAVMAAGGQVVRLEVPGSGADFSAYSIQRTGLAATLLEQVIGLQYGLIAVNRRQEPVRFEKFSPVGPGEALVLDGRDPALRVRASRAG
jgi:hypothetical protein